MKKLRHFNLLKTTLKSIIGGRDSSGNSNQGGTDPSIVAMEDPAYVDQRNRNGSRTR